MKRSLRALLVEDNPDDAELLMRELRRAGFDLTARRVDTPEGMREALAHETWEIVLSDYAMPEFSALEALEILRASRLPIPFIIISGTIGEDAAVEALKSGAQDFLTKGRLARLPSSIERALREANIRKEREAAEGALRKSELKYRRIVETSQEGIWMIDADGKTTYVNSRMAEMLGTDPSETLGASFLDFVDEDWKQKAMDHVSQREPRLSVRRELKFRRKDGSEFWAVVSTTAIVDAEQGYAGALTMVTDVTEQRKLQAQLMVSDRMASVGILAAGVAHEINNPLSAAIANLDLAIQDVTEEMAETPSSRLSEVLEQLRDARQASERVRDIVLDLKIFSRAQDEKRELVDVVHVLESSARMAWNEIRHRARLVKEFSDLPPVQASESRLGQVFLNLIVNAAQAIPEGQAGQHEIRLTTRVEPDGRVMVEVKDSGSGMSAAVKKRLFTPFFTTKAIGVGTGLGLSICHRIVSAFGGEISVESEVGEGSAFRVYLPAARESSRVSAEPLATPPSPSRRAIVLVVDDEEIVGTAIRRALAREHDVTATTNARDALRQIAAGARFDIILCDLMMPHMTGMDLHAELSRVVPEMARRMVFLTGGAFTATAREFLERVENTWMEKPFDVKALRALVAASVK